MARPELAEAFEAYAAAQALATELVGASSWYVAHAQHRIGRLHREAGRSDLARQALRAANELLSERTPPRLAIEIRLDRADALDAIGDPNARHLRTAAMELCQRYPDGLSADTDRDRTLCGRTREP